MCINNRINNLPISSINSNRSTINTNEKLDPGDKDVGKFVVLKDILSCLSRTPPIIASSASIENSKQMNLKNI